MGCGIYRDGAGLQRWVVGSIGMVLGSRGGLWIYRDGAGLQRWVVGSIGMALGSRGGLWDL